MHLTTEEEALLDSSNPAERKAMHLLVELGEIYGADRLVEIGSAQASGISYKSIGDPGVQFLESFAEEGAAVSVPTFANPAGMDFDQYDALGIDDSFAENQHRIRDALETMGITLSFTCTPYLAGNLPREGEHVAWAESSAVSFANSVIGAKTNREGGPSAIAAAITGRTPDHGLHRDENRRPTHRVRVDATLDSTADIAALGSWVGRRVEDGVPYFSGIEAVDTDDLKALGAAMAASGAVALYFVEGVTTDDDPPRGVESLSVGDSEIADEYDRLRSDADPDLVVIGCPHASPAEIADIASRVDGESLAADLWVCTSAAAKAQAERNGHVATIEAAGGTVLADTCNVVAPIEAMDYEVTATDSAKAANYLPGFCEQTVVFDDRASLIEGVIA
ncbi:MAG: aconitase X [Halococcoides sp.]